MNSNYMKEEKAIKTLAYKYMKPIANNIRLRFIIDYKKLKPSNLVISNNTSKESTIQMSRVICQFKRTLRDSAYELKPKHGNTH